jgi:poly-gamma-glutamate synthesis protein (capsule biosynthesis protein)
VNFLADLSRRTAQATAEKILAVRKPGDVVLVSIHWGGNWGYGVPREQREFAHRLVDEGAADVVHGHSSHHPKGVEHYRGRPILYGCGDFINDYEGISGYEEYRSDIVLGYFLTLRGDGVLERFAMAPFRTRRFRLERAARDEAEWLAGVLDREGRALGTAARLHQDGSIGLEW